MLFVSVDYCAASVRFGYLFLALLTNESLARIARENSKEFNHIPVESLQTKLPDITADSSEARDAVAFGETAGGSGGALVASGVPGKTKALDLYTEDLTATSRAWTIEPILVLALQIRQIVDILSRRRQSLT